MPLDAATMNQVTPALVRLSPKVWRERIVRAAQLRRAKQQADKAAREADQLWKAAQSEILAALAGAPGAVCGDLVVTAKSTAAAPATLTLATGEVIHWSKVTSLLVGNVTIPADQVAKFFGGRDGSTSIEVAGA